MQVYEVLGLRRREATSKRNGNKYIACNVYLAFEEPSVTGLACLDIFAHGENVPADIRPGDHVNIIYNRFGSVEAVTKIG